MPSLAIGGLTPLTTTDYPGCLAAVVFCQGCPWRCRYCHNPHLISRQAVGSIPWQEVTNFLERRKGLLDAVVFSGGEPTLQSGLEDAMAAVKGMGFQVGLHTGGMYPERLEGLIPWLDWVGFDVKAPFADYQRINGAGGGETARESIRFLLDARINVEFRTTCHEHLLNTEELRQMAGELVELGVSRWVLQLFRSQGCADEALLATPTSGFPSADLVAALSSQLGQVELRAA